MTLPVFESFGEGKLASNGQALTITAPSGIADDDMLICMLCTDGPETHTLPSGFAFIEQDLVVGSGGTRCTISVGWKRASSESGDYDCSWGSNEKAYGVVARFSGVDTGGTPIDDPNTNATSASATSIDAPSFNTAENDTLAVACFIADNDDMTVDGGFDTPDWSGITSDESGGSNGQATGAIQERDIASAGATTGCLYTILVAQSIGGLQFGLKPAVAAAGRKTYQGIINQSAII